MCLAKAGSLTHSSGLLGLAAVVGRMANVGLLVVLARSAGQQAVAFYGLATLGASFVALGASFGLSTYATRAVALGELDRSALRAIHTARAAVLALSVGVLAIVSDVFVPARFSVGYLLFAVAALADSLNDTSWSAVRGTSKAAREPATNASTYVAGLCVVVLLWRTSGVSFTQASIIWATLGVMRSLLACTLTSVWPTAGLAQIAAALRVHLRRALPYLGSDLLGLAYLRGDTFVLTLFVSTTALGSYVAAASFSSPLVQISAVMALGALARLGRSEGRRDLERVVDFFGIVGTAISVLIAAALPIAVVVLYGSSRGQILVLSLILMAFVPLRFCNSAVSSVVLLYGGAKYRLFIVLFSVVLNVGLNLALDGSMGARGAALATVFTEAFVTVGFLDALRRQRVRLRRRAFLMSIATVDCLFAAALSMSRPLQHHLGAASALFVALNVTILVVRATSVARQGWRRRARDAQIPANDGDSAQQPVAVVAATASSWGVDQ